MWSVSARPEEQITMQQHSGDVSGQNLAELFSRKINLSDPVNNDTGFVQQSDPGDPKEQAKEETPQFTYSISQHYTHSAHIVTAMNAQAVHAPTSELLNTGLSIYQTLTQHNIRPASLSPSQITLFQQADNDQRSRLIQLWSISPPGSISSDDGQEMADGIDEYQNVTIEQETERAWARHQGHASMGNLGDDDMKTAEYYMASGYEQLAQRDYQNQEPKPGFTSMAPSGGMIFGAHYKPSTDPVYQSTGWQLDDMEHQYGKFDQTNNFQAQAHDVVHIREPEDEEML